MLRLIWAQWACLALVIGMTGCSGGPVAEDAGHDASPEPDAAEDGCTTGAECTSGVCNDDGTCAEPACDDTVRNGDETDVDCGGSCAACDDGSTCTVDDDCASGRCAEGTCAPALLATGEDCTANDECESGMCRAFGTASVCTETCETTCPGELSACFEGLCTPRDYCDDPDGDGFGRGPGCTGTPCDACASTATCAELPGGEFECICNTGYSGDGLTCTDDDECALGTDTCHANASCTNTEGSFTCACNGGYSGDGTSCTDADECTLGTHTCDANASCTNTEGSFTCACNGGFSGDGMSCTDDDECALGTDDCHALATCTNTLGSFTCACPSDAFGDGRSSCTYYDSCRSLLVARPSTPSGDYTIDTGTGGPLTVHCDMTSDGGAGYTMVRFDDASLGDSQPAYRAFCAARGMEVIVPRTRAHALAIQAWNGGLPPNLVNVFPKLAGASGLANWEGRCRGASCGFWLSNSNNGGCLGFEPNGDNDTANALFLNVTGFCDYGHWNDLYGALSFTGHVICSTNDAGPGVARSCNDILTQGSVQNVGPNGIDGVYTIDPDGAGGDAPFSAYCDMTTAGGGWTLISIDGTSGRPTSFTGNAYPRPGASFYGDVAGVGATLAGIGSGATTATNYSIDAATLYGVSTREVLAYVGGSTRDYVRTTLPASCNFFDGSTYCQEDTYTGLTVTRSNGTVLTTMAQACTTAHRAAPWGADGFDEFGLHLLDGAESRPDLHCTTASASALGHQDSGRIYTTFQSTADTFFWTSGVHSHFSETGSMNVPGFLMLR